MWHHWRKRQSVAICSLRIPLLNYCANINANAKVSGTTAAKVVFGVRGGGRISWRLLQELQELQALFDVKVREQLIDNRPSQCSG